MKLLTMSLICMDEYAINVSKFTALVLTFVFYADSTNKKFIPLHAVSIKKSKNKKLYHSNRFSPFT